MTDRQIKTLIGQVAHTVLILRSEGVAITDAQAWERARDVVQIVLPMLEERDAETLEKLRSMAAVTFGIGRAQDDLSACADRVQSELEGMLAGHGCEVCGREIREGEGAFEVDGASSAVVITCGRCDEAKGGAIVKRMASLKVTADVWQDRAGNVHTSIAVKDSIDVEFLIGLMSAIEMASARMPGEQVAMFVASKIREAISHFVTPAKLEARQ